jgi:hypothetical protein
VLGLPARSASTRTRRSRTSRRAPCVRRDDGAA